MSTTRPVNKRLQVWCDDCGEERRCVSVGVRVDDGTGLTRDALMCRECLTAALAKFDAPTEAKR